MKCVICKNNLFKHFLKIEEKKYWRCNNCKSIFLDKFNLLDSTAEKNHYLNHQNFIKDKNYQDFLSNLYRPLKLKVKKNSYGLDYGCGNGPALAYMLCSDGYILDLYDPYFYPNVAIFKKKYDFITCSEVVEHFQDPVSEFDKINSILKKNGILAVMTRLYNSRINFINWHYRRDPTHVIFYSNNTFKYIAKLFNWSLSVENKNVIFFKK